MQKFKNIAQVCLVYVAALVLVGSLPITAFAQTPISIPPTVTEETPPTAPVPPERTYTYNETAKRWESDKYKYDTAIGKYYEVPPAPAPVPAPSQVAAPASPTISQPESAVQVNNTTDVSLDNKLTSNATTGDATVSKNTRAGDATTGDAAAIATFMNSINSSVGTSNGADFASFVTDVVGDVHGDIMLYPMLLKAMLEAANKPKVTDTKLTNETNSKIKNDIELNATSGDATVSGNTHAGSATTGTANTVVNVMNFINSMIAANGSFVGTINIHGNLDGDILVAPDFLPQLLASNAKSSLAPTNTIDVSNKDTQSIVNNVTLVAETGDANVTKNTNAGNATTGDASTNLVLLNLSGHQVVASNSLLVFVNVLGKWVGIIVDAPTGSTAAALGNGVKSHTHTSPSLTVDNTTNSHITNNIDLTSKSGNATVDSNTNAGNATTGNATASANIANISGSQLGLSDWFGVLFINVFGNWHGSFGVDTAHGTVPISGGVGARPGIAKQLNGQSGAIAFIPKPISIPQMLRPAAMQGSMTTPFVEAVHQEKDEQTGALSASSNTTPPVSKAATAVLPAQSAMNYMPYVTSAFLLGLGVVAGRNMLSLIRSRFAA